uniref:Uncharacterized protein n=1 Tax=Anguilla anguilla TaxID=7936 RepID=A0A0E9Q183_ANGAN
MIISVCIIAQGKVGQYE